jgi:hypothetical protein
MADVRVQQGVDIAAIAGGRILEPENGRWMRPPVP